MDFEKINLIISDDVSSAMEQRGIQEIDIRQMLAYAESEGNKLISTEGDRLLGKKRIGNFTIYAEYRVLDDSIEICNVYSHRIQLLEDQKEA